MDSTGVSQNAGSGPRGAVTSGGVVLMCLIWGSTWWVIKAGLEDLPPVTAVAIRFTGAALLFALLVPALARREGGSAPNWKLSFIQGTLTFAYPVATLYWVETRIPSGLAAVLWSVFPMVNAWIGERLLAQQRLTRREWAGFGLGFLGVSVLFVTDLRGLGPAAMAASAIYLTAPVVSALGNVLVKRDGGGVSSVMLNRNGLAIGAVLTAVVALVFERNAELRWTQTALLSLGYLTVVGTVVTFGVYFWLLRYAASHKLALIAYVIPVIALIVGWALGGEPLGASTLAGTGLILGGIALVAK